VRPRPKKFFKAEATMYEAEPRHVREQLSVYEHEDYDIDDDYEYWRSEL